jgi:hypothetical protein
MTKEEMIKAFEKIKEGCQNVKTEDGITPDAKNLATLVIQDCNAVLNKVKEHA